MGEKTAKRLAKLEANRAPIELQDVLPEAARKALLNQYLLVRQLSDLSDPAQMAMLFEAVRKSLQVFLSCGQYFDPPVTEPFEDTLAELVSLLENVVHFQQLLKELSAWHDTLDEERHPTLDGILERVIKRAGKSGKALTTFLNGKAYARFNKDYSKFLLKDGKGAVEPDAPGEPYEVRHLLPVILHEHLASVRAYDNMMTESGDVVDSEILNELYHQVVALRDLLGVFEDVLGTSIGDFVEILTEMSNLLGLHHHTDFALAVLTPARKMDEPELTLLGEIRAKMEQEWVTTAENFPAMWSNFGTRTSQRKFSDSLLVLR